MSLDIFTIHHKYDRQLDVFRRSFLPIQAGAALSSNDLKILRDDKHGTLSARNQKYCELSAFDEIYHYSIASHVGVMHYRRIFVVPRPFKLILKDAEHWLRVSKYRLGLKNTPVERHFKVHIDTKTKLEFEVHRLQPVLADMTKEYDIITPISVKYHGQTLREQYGRAHQIEHFDLFMEALAQLHPQLIPFIAMQDAPPIYYIFNMFIMRRDIFKHYWDLLSSTLLAIEKKINFDDLDSYQTRVLGFLAERFMAIFVHYMVATQSARCAQLPVAQCDF